MLKKRIYLPDKCLGEGCGWFKHFKEACSNCPIFIEDSTERKKKLIEAHRKAALVYYHKNKNVKQKKRIKKVKKNT